MIYLAYRVSTHHHYGESESQTREHIIDADEDLFELVKRVNEHFALPATINSERGTKHEISAGQRQSSPTYIAGGGGTDYTANIEIREAPTLVKTHRAREALWYGRKDENGDFKPDQKFSNWVPVTEAVAESYSKRDNYQVQPLRVSRKANG